MDADELAEILDRELMRELEEMGEPPVMIVHPDDYDFIAKWYVVMHPWDDPFRYVHINDYKAE